MNVRVFDTIFESSELEDRFRRYLCSNANVEIGGYLFGNLGTPSSIRHNDWWKILGTDNYPMTITDWLLVPNYSNAPKREFRWANIDYLKAAVYLSSRSKGIGSTLNFHSHPKGSTAQPSQADIEFAVTHCEIVKNRMYEFAVVSSYPMRVIMYGIERSNHNGKQALHMDSGVFWSWREKAISGMWRG